MKKSFGIIIGVIALAVTIILTSVSIGQNREIEIPSENIINEVEVNQEDKENLDLQNSTDESVEEITKNTTEDMKNNQDDMKNNDEKKENHISETKVPTTEMKEQKPEEEQDEYYEDGGDCALVIEETWMICIGDDLSYFSEDELNGPLYSYSSDDESVAAIDEFGNIKAVGLGETTIYMQAKQDNIYYRIGVIVEPGFRMSIMELDNYACIQLTESYLYANIDGILPEDSYIEWSADNDNFDLLVIKEDNVLVVTPKHIGETNITATVYYSDGTILAQESVEIVSDIERHF